MTATHQPYATRLSLLTLSAISFMVYIGLASLLFYFFHDASLKTVFFEESNISIQLITGIVFGWLFAFFVIVAIFRSSIASILKDYAIVEVLSQLRLKRLDQVQLSLFAGMGEEILFRAAIQPLLGIWLTSLIFVAIHGYFKFRSVKHLLFGLIMFLLSIGLGLLYDSVGLYAAMAGHVVYDILIFRYGEKYLRMNRIRQHRNHHKRN